MNDDKTPLQMKSSDSGSTVEGTKQVNLKINCSEEMLKILAVAGNHPNLIIISYVSPNGKLENWWKVTPRFPFDDVDIALNALRDDLHKKFIEPASQKPKIVPPPRKKKR